MFSSLNGPSLNFGGTLLLPAFAAAFLGSTQLIPGRFNVWGTLLAIYVLATGVQGLQLVSGASWLNDMFNGVALIIAVALSIQRVALGPLAADQGALRARLRRAAGRPGRLGRLRPAWTSPPEPSPPRRDRGLTAAPCALSPRGPSHSRFDQLTSHEERSMTHDTADFAAIIATLVLALALAACGSDSSSSSSNASSRRLDELELRRCRGVATAQDAAQALRGGADQDHHHGAAQVRAARRQEARDARDERPEQPEAPEVAEVPRRDWRSWNYDGRQLRPRQPGDVQRRDRHGDHEEGQLHRRGRHPADARDDQEGPGRRREVGADVRAPGRRQGPDHRRRQRVRERRADGQGPRRLLHLRLQGQGQRRHRARPGVSDPRRASPTASRPRSRSSARTAR